MAPVLDAAPKPTSQDGCANPIGDVRQAAPQVTGYVLTIENITRNFEREAERDQALQALTDGNRAALGNIRAAVETLLDSPEMEPKCASVSCA
jgi:hypothetical protein